MAIADMDTDFSHLPARGPVLLLSCMDLRLMSHVAQFMERDGLTNRYDHVIMAGAALGALGANRKSHAHWQQTFQDHFDAALKLHAIKDVYIMEHRDCGAYKLFLEADGEFDDSEYEKEEATHGKYAFQLTDLIHKWAAAEGKKLNIKSFLMDLRGNVSLMSPPKKRRTVKKRAKKSK